MKKKTTLIKLFGLFFLLILFIFPITISAFDGRNYNPGSHMELTAAAFSEAYNAPSGTAVLGRTVPLVELSYYRYEPCRAVNFLADASRDPDLFYFGLDAPHAQTPKYFYSKELTAPELETIELNALYAYFRYMTEILGKARRCYENGEPVTALYLLSFYIHGYEDLFAHKGITNEQHGWLAKKKLNPDDDPESMQQCRESLPQLAVNLPSLLGNIAGDEFRTQIISDVDITILSKKEREKILGRKHDILWEGIKFKLTSVNDSCARYIREISWDYKVIKQILISREAMDELAVISNDESVKTFLEKWGYDFQVNYVQD